MVSTNPPDIMADNDLRINEKRWRRTRLFRERHPRPATRILAILLVLVFMVLLGVRLETPYLSRISLEGSWQ